MKKLIYISFGITGLMFVILFSWKTTETLQGKNTETYHRFQTKDGFNWKGIFSPFQNEAHTVMQDTIAFSKKVIYPLGEKFQLVNPIDINAERKVAEKIAIFIDSCAQDIKVRYGLDYDRSSKAVRKYHEPKITIAEPIVILKKLTGTASPEARKDGFVKSIIPGRIEKENLKLARERLNRTDSILKKLGYNAQKRVSKELQFNSTEAANRAITNPSILDSMRYVQADVEIIAERAEVQTYTAPILLPLLILGVTLLALALSSMKIHKRKISWNIKPFAISNFIKNFLLALALTILFVAGIGLLMYLIYLGKNILYIIIIILGIISLLFMLYILYKHFSVILRFIKNFLKGILKFLSKIPKILGALMLALIEYVKYWWRRFLLCWDSLPACWKKVFVIMLLIIIYQTIW